MSRPVTREEMTRRWRELEQAGWKFSVRQWPFSTLPDGRVEVAVLGMNERLGVNVQAWIGEYLHDRELEALQSVEKVTELELNRVPAEPGTPLRI